MSAYNNPANRANRTTASSMLFPNNTNSPQQFSKSSSNFFSFNRQPIDNSSSELKITHPPLCMTTQSVIFAPRGQDRPAQGGLGKLDGMARQVNIVQSQQLSSQKRNSCDKAPFIRSGFPGRSPQSFHPQFNLSKPVSRTSNEEEILNAGDSVKKVILPHKRRDSTDLTTVSSKDGIIDQKFRCVQRVPPFQPITSNQSKNIQKNDCQSTNSGSGNELVKPKQFDFLKKKKQGNNGSISPLGTAKTAKNFNSMNKSSIIWPLSTSLMEQKMSKTFDQENGTMKESSLAKSQSNPIEMAKNIEFKKKNLFENSSPQPINTRQTQMQLSTPSKFVPNKSVILKSNEKDDMSPLPSFITRISAKPSRQITIDDFQIVNKLGKGAFGDVFMALQKTLGLLCVLKKMSKKRIKQAKVQEHIIRQIKLQTYLSNEHLTSLYGFFHDGEYLYLIMELLPDGSLQQIKKKKKLPEKQTTEIVKQVARGLKYMHQEFIIHRDLKPENIFLNEGYVKIGDFGCSIYHNATGLRNTIVGCLQYSSPEQLSKEGYTEKIDSWSLGILTYELLFGKSPFQSDIKKMLMSGQCSENKAGLSEVTFPTTPLISEPAKMFITNLLDSDPDKRMDMDEAIHHAFLKQTEY